MRVAQHQGLDHAPASRELAGDLEADQAAVGVAEQADRPRRLLGDQDLGQLARQLLDRGMGTTGAVEPRVLQHAHRHAPIEPAREAAEDEPVAVDGGDAEERGARALGELQERRLAGVGDRLARALRLRVDRGELEQAGGRPAQTEADLDLRH
ncbi:MAG TPA: hypothetical protein VMV46_07485 [Thermoanaerobaculia bacterium]|nr:hypothetical protein [Thermoanaerobaculia bacterium]